MITGPIVDSEMSHREEASAFSEQTLERGRLRPGDAAAHDWYRFVLAFPPHLVQRYISEFNLTEKDTLLDPFCGTGTTLIEGKRLGIKTVGLDSNPMARFASHVKTDWTMNGSALRVHAFHVAAKAQDRLAERRGRRRTLPPQQLDLLLSGSISPLPLHKTLILLDHIREMGDNEHTQYELLALARCLSTTIGNLHFGPEVGVGKPKPDVDVLTCWLAEIDKIAADLINLRAFAGVPSTIHNFDARRVDELLPTGSVTSVITSPPYPNEKDYTRATRLESVILGFLTDRSELRSLKQHLVRSNTKNVYKHDTDHEWVANSEDVQMLSLSLEQKRVLLNKTSGFERLYPKVATLYFGGMARHLANLRTCLKPGARLAYVVGDQASYFRVLIQTGTLLANIATSLGYTVVRRDLFRLRQVTTTSTPLREEVLILHWNGASTESTPPVPHLTA